MSLITYRSFEHAIATTESIFKGLDTAMDLAGMYHRLGLDARGGMSRHAIEDHIKNLLRGFAKEDKAGAIEFFKWRKIGAIDSVMHHKSQLTEGFVAADTLRSYIGPLDKAWHVDDLNAIARLVKGLMDLNASSRSRDFKRSFPELFHTANAVALLAANGCVIDYEQGDIVISDGEAQIVQRIEKNIRQFGAMAFIRECFKDLSASYYDAADRIVMTYAPQPDPDLNEPVIPWGFLLNLAAKNAHLEPQRPATSSNGYALREAVNLAKALLAITSTQRYHILGTGMFSAQSAPELVRSQIIFDACFSVPQTSLSLQATELSFLFDWVQEHSFETKYGFTIAAYKKVTEVIAHLCKGIIGPVEIRRRDLYGRLEASLSRQVIKKILDQIVHPYNSINKQFSNFNSQSAVNVYLKPLAALQPGVNNGTYYILDPRWTAFGFFEVLYNLCRSFPEYITEIGNGIENMIKALLTEHSVLYCSGFYDALGFKGDSDVLIETENTILLLEVKKTQLTRTAQAGDALHALVDLSDTVIKSQEQAGRIEIILRKQGYIDLTDCVSGQTRRVQWNYRDFERISVTHLDFNSLHDRVFVMRMLEVLLNVQVERIGGEHASDAVLARLKRLNRNLVQLTKQYWELYPSGASGADRPYFDCWFLPLGYLRLLLKEVTGAEQFLKALREHKHLTFGSGNVYLEYWIRRMGAMKKIS